MNKRFRDLSEILGSKWTTVVFCAVFIILAARIAFTKVYPLPFDEGFHFGLIQLYTHHLNPFLSGQPVGADAFGAVSRNPSYLYHYLMSFPLRLIGLFTHVTIRQIIALRAINIGFGVTSLVLLKKLTGRFGASAAMANLAVLALAITPVFYDVSGQINYDNLAILMTLFTLLVTWNIVNAIKQGRVSLIRLGTLLTLLLLTSLVKYTFLPIMGMIGLYVSGLMIARLYRHRLAFSIHWRSWASALTILMVLTSSILWVQRYGVNLVVYHTPSPQCSAVLNVSTCSQYGAWYRNYQLEQTYASHPVQGLQLVAFTKTWVHSIYDRVYSLVKGNPGQVVFQPIAAMVIFAKFILAGSLLYGLIRWRRARGSHIPWVLFGMVVVGYSVALWGQNFRDFHHLGAFIGLQGRYMLLILPLVYAAAARMYTLFVEDIKLAWLRLAASQYNVGTRLKNATKAYSFVTRRTKTFQNVLRSIR